MLEITQIPTKNGDPQAPQPKLQVAELLAFPRLLTVDPDSYYNQLPKVKREIGKLSLEELKDGTQKLLRALEQESNPDPHHAAQIRRVAGALLVPLVEWGISKGVPGWFYADELGAALQNQQEKLAFSGESRKEQHWEEKIYDTIRGLVAAIDTITPHLLQRNQQAVHTALSSLNQHIGDREIHEAISQRVRRLPPEPAEVQSQKDRKKPPQKRPRKTPVELAAFRAAVLPLYKDEGKTAAEIAAELAVPTDTVDHAIRWLKEKGEIRETRGERQRREAKEWRALVKPYIQEGKLTDAEIVAKLPERLRREPKTIAAYRRELEAEVEQEAAVQQTEDNPTGITSV